MGSLEIAVARHGLSIGDVYEDIDDGGSYWVHEEEGECWLTKGGLWVGEAMADEIDWDETAVNSNVVAGYWSYHWPDAARDRALAKLDASVRRARDALNRGRVRDHERTMKRLRKLGHTDENKIPNNLYVMYDVESHETAAALAATDRAEQRLFAYHREYILSRRTPIKLGIYGTT